MASSLDELRLRIEELKADFGFVSFAAQLRPRLGDILLWNAGTEALTVARDFMAAKSSRPEGIYGPLFVRLMAVFERHLRRLVAQTVEQRSSQATSYDSISKTLGKRNIALTGKVLAAIDSPRDHLKFDIEKLIQNLASCRSGSGEFRLNAQAFSATVTGTTPTIIDKALSFLEVTGFWDAVGSNPAITASLETSGARETRERARERLEELCRWRNQLAHGGDEEISISKLELENAINFITCFCEALDVAIKETLRKRSRRA